jgi:hypothetical protein
MPMVILPQKKINKVELDNKTKLFEGFFEWIMFMYLVGEERQKQLMHFASCIVLFWHWPKDD